MPFTPKKSVTIGLTDDDLTVLVIWRQALKKTSQAAR